MKHLSWLAAASLVATPMLASAQAPAGADAGEKRICKRIKETGPLVKGKRVCLTAREWSTVSENAQRLGRDMQTQVSTERG